MRIFFSLIGCPNEFPNCFIRENQDSGAGLLCVDGKVCDCAIDKCFIHFVQRTLLADVESKEKIQFDVGLRAEHIGSIVSPEKILVGLGIARVRC